MAGERDNRLFEVVNTPQPNVEVRGRAALGKCVLPIQRWSVVDFGGRSEGPNSASVSQNTTAPKTLVLPAKTHSIRPETRISRHW